MISPDRYAALAAAIVEASERLSLSVLAALAAAARDLLDQPASAATRNRFRRKVRASARLWQNEITAFLDGDLLDTYIAAAGAAGRQITAAVPGAVAASGGQIPPVGIGFSGGKLPPASAAALRKAGLPRHLTAFAVIRAGAERALHDTVVPVLRWSEDAYRRIAASAALGKLGEGETYTRRSVTQAMLDRFASEGVTAITYEGGRNVGIDTYAEMAARTAIGQATVQASMNRYAEYGFDLVRVSAHPRPAPMCQPWEHKILSRTGDTLGYPTYAEAHDGGRGLHHPNCGHSVTAYIPGVSLEELPRLADPAEQALYDKHGKERGDQIAYRAQQRQRQIERKIREYKRRQAVALGEDAQEAARRKVNAWRARMREHMTEHPYLRRKPERERVAKPGGAEVAR